MHPTVCRAETTRNDLRQAHKNIAKLIVMNRGSSVELSALKVEYERLKWTLSEMYARERRCETSRMGYAYGDYIRQSKPSSGPKER